MKVGELLSKMVKLDPNMELNDLRGCVTTNADDIVALRELLDGDTGTWEEYGARLTSRAVLPLLLEIRDLMLMPASRKAWLKPAEMAAKVAKEADAAIARCEVESAAARAECEEQTAATVAECEEQLGAARSEFDAKLSKMAEEHLARAGRERDEHQTEIDRIGSEHRDAIRRLEIDHSDAVKQLEYQIKSLRQTESQMSERLEQEQDAVPVRQAEAVAAALENAAEKSEALARLRLAMTSKRKGLFRDRQLDNAMLRVEADGFLLAAKRLRQMAEEAAEQGRWPVEFAEGEEADAPDVVAEPDAECGEAEELRVAET